MITRNKLRETEIAKAINELFITTFRKKEEDECVFLEDDFNQGNLERLISSTKPSVISVWSFEDGIEILKKREGNLLEILKSAKRVHIPSHLILGDYGLISMKNPAKDIDDDDISTHTIIQLLSRKIRAELAQFHKS